MHFLWNMRLITCKKCERSGANATFFVSGYIGRSVGRGRKCAACKDILLVNRDNEIFPSDNVFQDYMKLFDDADRGLLAVPMEFCFALMQWFPTFLQALPKSR